MEKKGLKNDLKEMVSLVESNSGAAPPHFSEPRINPPPQKENKNKNKGSFECEICSVKFMKVINTIISDIIYI